jgi:hypothetical protein
VCGCFAHILISGPRRRRRIRRMFRQATDRARRGRRARARLPNRAAYRRGRNLAGWGLGAGAQEADIDTGMHRTGAKRGRALTGLESLTTGGVQSQLHQERAHKENAEASRERHERIATITDDEIAETERAIAALKAQVGVELDQEASTAWLEQRRTGGSHTAVAIFSSCGLADTHRMQYVEFVHWWQQVSGGQSCAHCHLPLVLASVWPQT